MRSDDPSPQEQQDTVSNLDAVVLVALLFSCCLAPLILAALAFVSIWINGLTAVHAYRLWPLVIAIIIGLLGWRQIYRPRAACVSGKACTVHRAGFGAQVIFWLTTVSTGYVLGLPYLEKYF